MPNIKLYATIYGSMFIELSSATNLKFEYFPVNNSKSLNQFSLNCRITKIFDFSTSWNSLKFQFNHF